MFFNSRLSLEELDPDKLLEPTAVTVISAINEAALLEDKYITSLKPVKHGVYRAGDIYPLGQEKVTELINNGFQAKLYTQVEDIVSRLEINNNRNSRLYEKPTVPARGLQLIEHCINNEISKINPFAKCYHSERCINNLLLDASDLTVDDILNDCSSLLSSVIRFIGDDIWHIYFVKLKGNDIILIKTIDYRIYDWHRNLYNSLKSEQENKY